MTTQNVHITTMEWTLVAEGVCMIQPKGDVLMHITSGAFVSAEVGFKYPKEGIYVNTDALTNVWMKKLTTQSIYVVVAKD